MSKGLEVWFAVKKYINLYHHQVIKENIDVKSVEGMPIDVIEKELKTLEIIKEKRVNVDNFLNRVEKDTDYKEYKRLCDLYKIMIFSGKELTQDEFDLLKEVLI